MLNQKYIRIKCLNVFNLASSQLMHAVHKTTYLYFIARISCI